MMRGRCSSGMFTPNRLSPLSSRLGCTGWLPRPSHSVNVHCQAHWSIVGTMTVFSSDPIGAARRVADLKSYFEQHVLTPTGQFICSSERPCKGSHAGSFYAGQLPHIGASYGLMRNGAPFRVVAVGQEYGHGPEFVDLEERREMIVDGSALKLRFRAENGYRARNPHMKGCTSILRLLFDHPLGSDHQGEFVQLNGTPTHLFDCFALVNFLLCSAVPSDRRRPSKWHATVENLVVPPGRCNITAPAISLQHSNFWNPRS